jgi:hypothetical protein
VFIPDSEPAEPGGLTYAELVEKHGLEYKVEKLSQSTKAMRAFLEALRKEKPCFLWA